MIYGYRINSIENHAIGTDILRLGVPYKVSTKKTWLRGPARRTLLHTAKRADTKAPASDASDRGSGGNYHPTQVWRLLHFRCKQALTTELSCSLQLLPHRINCPSRDATILLSRTCHTACGLRLRLKYP